MLGADATVAIVRAESVVARDPGEGRSVEQFTETVARELRSVEVGCAVISDLDFSASRLKAARLVILPYNPTLPPKAIEELTAYARGGGKILAFYLVPQALQAILGIEGGAHFKAPREGYFSSLRFKEGAVPGAPPVVRQRSWNITDAKPVPGSGQVLAEWCDDRGEPTGHAAILGSKRGLLMTHVLLSDDPANKRQMLLALTGYLVPEIWQKAAEASLGKVGQLAGYKSFGEATEQISRLAGKKSQVAATLQVARELRQEASQFIAAGQYAPAMQKSAGASDQLQRAFCLAQDPKPGEFRAFWCHSAFGVDGIEWDEAIRRLAENGFTAILPNLLWGGAAFYDSSVLPVAPQVAQRGDQVAQCVAACRKYGLQIHVWKVNWNLGHAAPKEFVERMSRAGRLQADSRGKEEPWLCPSHPGEPAARNRFDGGTGAQIRPRRHPLRLYPLPRRRPLFLRRVQRTVCARQRADRKDWPQDALANGPLRQPWLEWRRANITKVVEGVSRASPRPQAEAEDLRRRVPELGS